ncbi:MAG: flap endonuclease [Acidimicrobiia bacterium]|nr:flap endonuclease [Acidimicrobiia bacterium]
MQLHLLDGTYELFRSFFGAPPRLTPDGREVGAVAGIIASTLSLLREPGVTHLAVATDYVIESFRNQMFDGYKTGEGIPEELMGQFRLAEAAWEAMGVRVWPMVEFEADDGMASGAWKFEDQVERVVLLSPDKDLSQCVDGDRVVTYDRRQEIERNEQGVWEKFGVAPSSISDYLGLVGDTADGIPGLPGWGAKSTATVLAHYRTIEEIPDDAADWDVKVRSAAKLAETLAAHREEALLYRELAVLRRDVPIPDSLDDLEWRGPVRADYEAFCTELGFDGLLDRPHKWQD